MYPSAIPADAASPDSWTYRGGAPGDRLESLRAGGRGAFECGFPYTASPHGRLHVRFTDDARLHWQLDQHLHLEQLRWRSRWMWWWAEVSAGGTRSSGTVIFAMRARHSARRPHRTGASACRTRAVTLLRQPDIVGVPYQFGQVEPKRASVKFRVRSKGAFDPAASCCSGAMLSTGRVAGRARTFTLSWEHRLWPEPAAANLMAVEA